MKIYWNISLFTKKELPLWLAAKLQHWKIWKEVIWKSSHSLKINISITSKDWRNFRLLRKDRWLLKKWLINSKIKGWLFLGKVLPSSTRNWRKCINILREEEMQNWSWLILLILSVMVLILVFVLLRNLGRKSTNYQEDRKPSVLFRSYLPYTTTNQLLFTSWMKSMLLWISRTCLL